MSYLALRGWLQVQVPHQRAALRLFASLPGSKTSGLNKVEFCNPRKGWSKMHDKPWLLTEQIQRLYDFYVALFGAKADELFAATVKVNLPDQGY